NWGKPASEEGTFYWLWANKWWITAGFSVIMVFSLIRILKIKTIYVLLGAGVVLLSYLLFRNPLISFVAGSAALSIITLASPGEPKEWFMSSWGFAKQIL